MGVRGGRVRETRCICKGCNSLTITSRDYWSETPFGRLVQGSACTLVLVDGASLTHRCRYLGAILVF